MHKPGTTNIHKPSGIKSRNDVLKELRERFGPNTPRTLRLFDSLIGAWDTIDLLTKAFSAELAHVYLQAGFEPGELTDDDNE